MGSRAGFFLLLLFLPRGCPALFLQGLRRDSRVHSAIQPGRLCGDDKVREESDEGVVSRPFDYDCDCDCDCDCDLDFDFQPRTRFARWCPFFPSLSYPILSYSPCPFFFFSPSPPSSRRTAASHPAPSSPSTFARSTGATGSSRTSKRASPSAPSPVNRRRSNE